MNNGPLRQKESSCEASDADVVRRVFSGDRKAYALLVRRYLVIVKASLIAMNRYWQRLTAD